MQDIQAIFQRLAESDFRKRQRLGDQEKNYLRQKGMDVILEHGRTFFTERLAPEEPTNDGKQTPMRGHPVFIAQHATATCCRKCLEEWHGIPKGRKLQESEIDYILSVIALWLGRGGKLVDMRPRF